MTDPCCLIDAYLDDTLSKEAFAQFEQNLETSIKYADAFAQAMMIDTLLEDRFERDSITSTMQLDDGSFLRERDMRVLQNDYEHADADLVTIVEIPADKFSYSEAASAIGCGLKSLIRSRPTPFIVSLSAALLMLAFWLINPFADDGPRTLDDRDELSVLHPQDKRAAVAALSAEHDARWAQASLAVGGPIYPGQRLFLIEGFAEITTHDGAVVILQAPCSVELIDHGNAIRLNQGKLFGACLSPRSRGFSVYTEHARIVDLGTRFGVEVDSNGDSSVLVQEGEIVVSSTPGNAGSITSVARSLTSGQSVKVKDNGSVIRDITYRPLAFVSDAEFDAMSQADTDPYQRWLAQSYELRRRDDLVAYYTFEKNPDRTTQLDNLADSTSDRFHGELVGGDGLPRWSEGRWAKKGALQFDRKARQMVRVPFNSIEQIGRELSIVMWLKMDDLSVSQHLITQMPPGYPNQMGLNMGWNGEEEEKSYPERSIFFSINREEGDAGRFGDKFYAAPPIQRQQWVCLAVTTDGHTKSFYLNGKRFGRIRDAERYHGNQEDLLIGGVDLNFSHFETFGGSIDELAMFRTTLTSDELMEIYLAGRPTETH